MLSVCGICFIILFLLEYRIVFTIIYFVRAFFQRKQNNECTEMIDDDVQDEKLRISDMTKNQIKTHNLVVQDMTKKYGNILAVNRMSVVVNQ